MGTATQAVASFGKWFGHSGQTRNDRLIVELSGLCQSDNSQDRVKGINLLSKCDPDLAKKAALDAIQAYGLGAESSAAQGVLIKLGKQDPKKSLEIAGEIIRRISPKCDRGEIDPSDGAVTELAKTIKALVSVQGTEKVGDSSFDTTLGNWFDGQFVKFTQMQSELTRLDPSAQETSGNLAQEIREPLNTLRSLTVLVLLISEIDSPEADRIRLALVEKIRPDTFGIAVLKALGPNKGGVGLQAALDHHYKSWSQTSNERVPAPRAAVVALESIAKPRDT